MSTVIDVPLFDLPTGADPTHGTPIGQVLASELHAALHRAARFSTPKTEITPGLRLLWLWSLPGRLVAFAANRYAAVQTDLDLCPPDPPHPAPAGLGLIALAVADVKTLIRALTGVHTPLTVHTNPPTRPGLTLTHPTGTLVCRVPAAITHPDDRRTITALHGLLTRHATAREAAGLPQGYLLARPDLLALFASPDHTPARMWFTGPTAPIYVEAGPHWRGVLMPVKDHGSNRSLLTNPHPLPDQP